MGVKVLPYGDRALLAEYLDLDEAMGAYAALERTRPDGVTALVPAARTVLVRLDPAVLSLGTVERWIVATAADRAATADAPPVTLAVHYDGPDLESTAELLSIDVATLIERHTAQEWRCAFIGFAPGFGYLTSPHSLLDVPRLTTSRSRVPRGAVGLAGEFSGVYPRESPGGWRLIGRTDAVLWDIERASPALIAPGTRVRFAVAS